jgi:hypothetical protein
LKLFSRPRKPLVTATHSFFLVTPSSTSCQWDHTLTSCPLWRAPVTTFTPAGARQNFVPSHMECNTCVCRPHFLYPFVHSWALFDSTFWWLWTRPCFQCLGVIPRSGIEGSCGFSVKLLKEWPDCHLPSTAAPLSFLTSNAQILCILSCTHYLLVLFFFFGGYWGLNSEPYTWKTGALLLELLR